MKRITFTAVLICLLALGCANYLPPEPKSFYFSSRTETKKIDGLRVSVVVLTTEESKQVFGAPLNIEELGLLFPHALLISTACMFCFVSLNVLL